MDDPILAAMAWAMEHYADSVAGSELQEMMRQDANKMGFARFRQDYTKLYNTLSGGKPKDKPEEVVQLLDAGEVRALELLERCLKAEGWKDGALPAGRPEGDPQVVGAGLRAGGA